MVTRSRLNRADPHERRDNIIAVAKEAFGRDGYGATTMSTIAALLGGSKATLYKYFPSKEMLFEAVMQHHCGRMLVSLRDLNEGGSDDLEALLAGFGVVFLTRLYEPDALDVYRLIHSEGARFPELAAIFFRSGPDEAVEELRAMLAACLESGRIVCDDCLLAAGQFLGMLRGDRHMRYAVGITPPATAQEIAYDAQQAAKMFVRGLLSR